MRTAALVLLLLGVLAYLAPQYRAALPVGIPLNDPNVQLLGELLIGLGIIVVALRLLWRRP